jgi:hypothetical protein
MGDKRKMTGEELNILSKIKVRPVEEQRDYLLEQNMLLAGKIATLEKENAELRNLKDVADLIRLNNSSIVTMAQLNNNNVALRKENAELKKKNLDIQDAVTMQMYTNKANKEIADRQLTKAKEIIRSLYFIIQGRIDYKGNIPLEDEMYRANQFLNSEVEKC